MLAWLCFVEVERVGHYLLVALPFVAGLLSKSVVVTMRLTLLLVFGDTGEASALLHAHLPQPDAGSLHVSCAPTPAGSPAVTPGLS